MDAYGVEADISQPTISAETVENDPKLPALGRRSFRTIKHLRESTDLRCLAFVLVRLTAHSIGIRNGEYSQSVHHCLACAKVQTQRDNFDFRPRLASEFSIND